MDFATVAALAGMAVAAFGAATLLPFQSEIVFVGLIAAETAPVWLIVTVASIANTGGSMVNWVMGRFIEHYRDRKWFPATQDQLDRAQHWYVKWGLWTLLLSWAPFGDVITVVAGVMRTPLWLFTVIVLAAKTGRYLAVAGLLDLI